jgi:hypothetical protein
MDEFAFRFPGITNVEHVYFYAVHGADEASRQRACSFGREF